MDLLKGFAQGKVRFTRIEAFSKNVFAIVVASLMREPKVLSLHDYGSVNEFGSASLELLPFPTALMGESSTNPLDVSLFGTVIAFNILLFIALQANILVNLIRPDFISLPHPAILSYSI